VNDVIPIVTPGLWTDYELIDSGNGAKLERFAGYTLSRPDPRALWKPADPTVWNRADAAYIRKDDTTGDWKVTNAPPDPWRITYGKLTFVLKATAFKHIGVFPEQAPNWDWIRRIIANRPLRILNLFAYTGGATLAALSAGASVTHVDASKPSITWAKENARASGFTDKPVRWILEDAYKFVLREGRRGSTYDGIIMDPPRFGRGAKGEVWKIEEDLPKLLTAVGDILAPKPSLFLLNAYTVDLSSIALSHVVRDLMRTEAGSYEAGELAIRDTTTGRLLPSGVFARWSHA